jgi:anti-sigma B factor antagonist
MAAPASSIKIADDAQHVTYQVHGWGTIRQSLPLRRHAEQKLAAGCPSVEIDLRHCSYLDSTFLGTMLFLLRACKGRCKFKLVSPSPPCQEILHQMKMDLVYPIGWEDEPAADEWRDLPPAEDGDAFRFNAVDAHSELARLPGAAGDPFRKVVKGLIDEIQQRHFVRQV